MRFFKSFVISFSMYSIIPMPTLDWDKDSMKYTMLFFPWIGLMIGAITYGWAVISTLIGMNSILSAVILILLPIIISGGIHLDGLIDTCDAVFSYGDKEKKLNILKDPRTGAFGVIGCSVYLLFLLGVSCQLLQTDRFLILLVLIFFISRTIGAIALLTVKSARENGLGDTFAKAADRRFNLTILILYLCIALSFVFIINVMLGFIVIVVLSSFLFLYINYINKNFGGITGDLTGFMITTVELLLLLTAAIGGIVLC